MTTATIDMTLTPTLPNGAQILARWEMRSREGYNRHWAVCCYWPQSAMPYVTWYVDANGNAKSGNYFQTAKAAIRDWEDRTDMGDESD